MTESLASPIITDGFYAKEFSTTIKSYLQNEHFFFTSSGAEALSVILKAMGIKPDDEIILPSYVCDSVYYAVENSGAKPILVDINENWVVDPEEIESKITSKTKAIIVVYTFGIACDIKSILKLGVPVIEDICQAMGLEIDEKKAGSFGIASFISFKAIKCVTLAGEGGGILTNNNELASSIQNLAGRNVFNDKVTEVNASFGYSQLKQYHSFLSKRKKIADKYLNLFIGSNTIIKTSFGLGMNYRFVVQTTLNVENTMQAFAAEGISLRKGVDSLLHKTFNISGNFKGTENAFNSTLSFPIYPSLTDSEFEQIKTAIKKLM